MGFAAAEPANVPAGAEGAAAAVDVGAAGMDGEGAEVPFAAPADGDGDDGLAAVVTLAACLEPKMADTILPKTLIFSSLRSRFIASTGFPRPLTRARDVFWTWVHLSLPGRSPAE